MRTPVRRTKLASILIAEQTRSRNLPARYNELKAWLSQMRKLHTGLPDISMPEVLDEIAKFVSPGSPQQSVDPTGTEYRYTPWLIREIGMGRLKTDLNSSSRQYVHTVLKWFEWFIAQDPQQIEQEFGFPAHDRSWRNIMSYTYSGRGGGLASLYRDFINSGSPLATQYRNYLNHS